MDLSYQNLDMYWIEEEDPTPGRMWKLTVAVNRIGHGQKGGERYKGETNVRRNIHGRLNRDSRSNRQHNTSLIKRTHDDS